MSDQFNRVLIIVGMHRSMTSLASHWLNKCGLNVGDDLHGADIGNVKGHYEDKDFLNLHSYLLSKNNTDWRKVENEKKFIDTYALEKSKILIELKNKLHGQWGWKDPRTCLFLEHWEGLLPEARYLIIYRPFVEVVDSLLRREFKVKNKAEYVLQWRKYASKYLKLTKIKEEHLRVWIKYNRMILDLVKEISKERYVVLRNDQLLRESEHMFKEITKRWGFELEYMPIKSLFDADITDKATPDFLDGVDESLVKRASEIQDQLAAYSIKNDV